MDRLDVKVGIIGAGNLGRALVTGFLQSKTIASKNIILSDPSVKLLTTLQKQGVKITAKNSDAAKADVVILAVKSSIAPAVLGEIKNTLGKNTLLISAVAGFSIAKIQDIIRKPAVVRIMPNLCVSVNASVTCWVKSKEVSSSQVVLLKKLLQKLGTEIDCKDEKMLVKVTVISGSGPAYIWYIADLLEKAAVDLGIEKTLAKKLVTQTLFGSAVLSAQTEKSYKELVDGVATKGGITQEALDVFEQEKLDKTFSKAIKKAYEKAKLLEQKAGYT